MKRTLTAATALVVSSAGAVGLAGTAAAVTTPQSPANEPVDHALAQTAGQGVDEVHKVVGDVVPAKPSAPRTAGPEQHDQLGNTVSHALGGHGGNTGLTQVLPQGEDAPNPTGSNVAGLPLGGAPQERSAQAETPPLVKPVAKVAQGLVHTDGKDGVVGELAQNAQQLAEQPAARSGEPADQGAGPLGPVTGAVGPLSGAVAPLAQGDLAPVANGALGAVTGH